MLTKLSLKAFLFLLVLSSFNTFAVEGIEDGIDKCGVPVCDMEITLDSLAKLNQNQRYNYANSMIAKYADSKDSNVLNNLYSVAIKLKDISKNAKDEDWVWRESNTLANTMVMGLAKYSETKGDTIISFYKLLTTAQKRYEIIDYWTQTSKTLENVSELNEVIIFAEAAEKHSQSLGDESWIPRAASSLISEITVKLTQLDPAHEGLYSVKLKSQDLLPGILAFDKIAILDSSSAENLVVVFYNSKFKRSSFVFKNSTISGNTIKGKFVSNADTSRIFSINLDRKTGAITGNIESTDSTISFTGEQIFSTRTVFKGATPYELTVNDAIGSFKGQIGNLDGTLTVKSFSAGTYAATFRTATGSIKMDFTGKFFPKNGVLTLTNNNEVKLVLSLRKNTEEEVNWVGYSFSSKNPSYINAKFSL